VSDDYVNFDGDDQEGPLWPRFNSSLHWSCERVEATPGRKVSAFLAFPAVCPEVDTCRCARVCLGQLRRDQVVFNARTAVWTLTAPARLPPIAR
jgi:hypothetical protein